MVDVFGYNSQGGEIAVLNIIIYLVTFPALIDYLQIEVRAPTKFFAIEYFSLQLKYFYAISYKINA